MRLRWAIPMLMLAGAVARGSAQTAAQFMLRISGPGTVAVGQPVQVRLLLQNTSDQPIGSEWPISLDGYVLSIHGPSGQELPRKASEWDGSSGLMSIGPGEVRDDVLRVDPFYDLSQPGRYTLQLKRSIADDHSEPEGRNDRFVSSNVITLTVSPEPVRASAPLELILSGPETFVSGSDVSLKVSAKNISDQDVFLVTDPDGSIADRNCAPDTVVVRPNGVRFSHNLTSDGPKVIRTISPGATVEAVLDKKALGFGAAWTPPNPYRFQLICSVPGYPEGGRMASNAIILNVTPPPAGGVTPFTLKLSGPETVAAGDAVRVELEETGTSDFGGGMGLLGNLNPLDPFIARLGYSISVRDPSGHELPLNSHASLAPGIRSFKSTETGPCNSYAVLSDYYDFSRPGAYRVQLSRYDRTVGDICVFSNAVTISVKPVARP
jgi:hypothetical protein